MTRIDKQKFGPWAIVTGASSGIGEAFAEHGGFYKSPRKGRF